MRWPNTLSGRLFALTALWALLSIALVAWIISQNYRAGAEANLIDRLTANLYNIMGSVEPNEDGRLVGRPDLRDSRFQSIRSGYYWSVASVADPTNRVTSGSLVGEDINLSAELKFDDSFQRQTRIVDQSGNRLVVIEAQAFLGEGDDLYSFKITGNRSEVDRQVTEFIRQLLIVLGLFAFGFVLVTYFIVRLGFSPLREASRQLGDIREGKTERIMGDFPMEIQPLIDETNALIASNRTVIERARTQVGNLAHSLKTPLAVLKNEGAKARPELRKIIGQQVEQMQAQIQAYLDRARISARAGTITSRTDIATAMERLVRVMQKLNPHIQYEFNLAGGKPLVFAGEQQDFEEMVGNLLENAGKFARKQILISADTDLKGRIIIKIEDDGEGMTKEECAEALTRGARIDESKPGTGLGLSIVKDIAGEYGGSIELLPSELGGLLARLNIPGAVTGKTV